MINTPPKYLLIFRCVVLTTFLSYFTSCHLLAQDIKVYFNQSVDYTASVFTDAYSSNHLDDTICKYIDLAEITLDIAVWDNGNEKITDHINQAYLRGVRVRYITSSNALNSALTNLNPGIPVLERNSGISSNVMHNKFLVMDQLYVLTGSMNLNDGAIFNDYNNLVVIHNWELGGIYAAEFNEMWGSNTGDFNLSTSKFGPDKSDNTVHSITIGGVSVESYFSPTDHTTAQIIDEIDHADHTLDIAMFTFIHNDIRDAVIAAYNRGVEIRCIIENVSYIGSEYDNLINAGIQVLSHDGVPYDFHHKYCAIDAKHTDSDPTIITGSHNWTNSAEEEYDENTLIIHDPIIAWQFTEEFTKRWKELGGTVSTDNAETNLNETLLFPNPNSGSFYLGTNPGEFNSIQIYTPAGEKIWDEDISHKTGNYLDPDLDPGCYFLVASGSNSVIRTSFVVQP